jgi:hypothetical protein
MYGFWKFWEIIKFAVLKSKGVEIERDVIEGKNKKESEEKEEEYSKV